MLKECAKRKLIITFFALIIFIFTMFFPKSKANLSQTVITYHSNTSKPVFLLNQDFYVVRTNIAMKSDNQTDYIREILSILTIDSKDSVYVPSLMAPVIPKNTKVLGISIQDNTVKVNFNKNLNLVPSSLARKMIECIVYTLTELEDIDKVMIFVEGTLLEYIPNTNEKIINPLTRDIGVNKIYEIEEMKNISKTTVYYISQNANNSYYIPVTLLDNNKKDKVEIIIERLKTKPNISTNLMSFLNANAELKSYEVLEQEIILSFNPYLYEGIYDDEIIESVTYSIELSMKDTLGVKKVQLKTQ